MAIPKWMKPPRVIVKVVDRRPPGQPPFRFPTDPNAPMYTELRRELFRRKLLYWTCVCALADLLILLLWRLL